MDTPRPYRCGRYAFSVIACVLATALPAAGQLADRPSYNTGEGFFTLGNKVYDANGHEFVVRGLNHTHWWGNQVNNVAAIPHIARTEANTVRLVFGDSFHALSPSQQRDLIVQYTDLGIVPMVEHHGATCSESASDLARLVDYWLEPGRADYLREFEDKIMLNIANEWGNSSTVWRDAYKTAVTRLRNADINALIVIDAGGNCGQNPSAIQNYGQDIIDHDPQHNILFSQHMYAFWRDNPNAPDIGTWNGHAPYAIQPELEDIVNQNLPLIIGEFSWQGASSVPYNTATAIQIFEDLGLGWLAWSWNQNSDPDLDMVRGYQYNSDADLTPFGDLIVNHPTLGLKALAEPATVFFNDYELGDINRDGEIDIADLDALVEAIDSNSTNGKYDMDDDGVVDGDDFAHWIESIFQTGIGDANLDHKVDAFDFAALAGNFNQNGTWSQGDFNGNGFVSAFDFSLLAENFNQTYPLGGEAASTPEPASAAMLGAALLTLARRRSQQIA